MSTEPTNALIVQEQEPPKEERTMDEIAAEMKEFFADTRLNFRASQFLLKYGYTGPFLKAGFLDAGNHVSFPAVALYENQFLVEKRTHPEELTFFYPGDPEGKGFETIQRITLLSYVKLAMGKGWKPEDLAALVLPEDRSSDKIIRMRLEASLGTRCSESMAYDYVYWVFTGKRRSWLFTSGEFLDLKI